MKLKSILEYEEGIINVQISELLLSKKSVIKTINDDLLYNRFSKSNNEPIELWKLDNIELLVVDGYHRVVEAIIKGIDNINATIVGEGYTDYYATPSNDNKFYANTKTKFKGLEKLVDISLLKFIYKTINK